MKNDIIITEWAFDSFLDLVGKRIIITNAKSSNYNYAKLKEDALLLKDYGTLRQSTKFKNKKFWEHFSGTFQPLFEMKWHNFGKSRSQLRLHVYLKNRQAFLLQGYIKNDANKQKREIIKSEMYAQWIDQGQFKWRGQLK